MHKYSLCTYRPMRVCIITPCAISRLHAACVKQRSCVTYCCKPFDCVRRVLGLCDCDCAKDAFEVVWGAPFHCKQCHWQVILWRYSVLTWLKWNFFVFTVLTFFFHPQLKMCDIYAAKKSKKLKRRPVNPLNVRLFCHLKWCDLASPTSLLFIIHLNFICLYFRLTFVACDEPHFVPFWFFDGHKQRGGAGHQYGHMKGRPRELCVKNKIWPKSDNLNTQYGPANKKVARVENRDLEVDK